MREIVFDTETTGLSPKDGHRLVEIGCIELVNRVETGRHFHCYINPERSMPSEAQAVHGLSDVFLSDKPVFGMIVMDFLEFIGDAPMVAHNARFDFSFINHELAQLGLEPVAMTRMVDTLEIARGRHPGAKHSLDALCSRYGIDRSQRTLHGALIDAQLLAQLYVELRGGRQIGLELVADIAIDTATITEPDSWQNQPSAPMSRAYRVPRPFPPSPDELARHAAFIAQLSDPLWPLVDHIDLTNADLKDSAQGSSNQGV
jgi:DNA polymerase-3 subunit epsilon